MGFTQFAGLRNPKGMELNAGTAGRCRLTRLGRRHHGDPLSRARLEGANYPPFGQGRTSRDDHPGGAVQRACREFDRQQAVALERTGSDSSPVLAAEKPKRA